MKRIDGSRNVALNPCVIASQTLADKLKVPVGEAVAWATVFKRPELARAEA